MGINDFIQVGNRIKDLRKRTTNLSQRDMANKLGIPVSTYSNYENNHREPPIDILNRIASILNVSLEDLLYYVDYEFSPEESIKALDELANEFFHYAGYEARPEGVNDAGLTMFRLTEWSNDCYFYADEKEVENVIEDSLGLMEFKLMKLKHGKKIFYNSI